MKNKLSGCITVMLLFFVFISPLLGQSRIPKDTGSSTYDTYLGISWATGNGSQDRIQVLFYEIDSSVTSSFYLAIDSPGAVNNVSPDDVTGGSPITRVDVVGGSGALSGSVADNFTFTDRDEAISGGTLLDSQTYTNEQTWEYMGPYDPAAGEKIGSKYYFRIVVSLEQDIDRNGYRMDVSFNNPGSGNTPSGSNNFRAFAYSWNISLLGDSNGDTAGGTDRLYELYPFAPDGSAADSDLIVFSNWDIDEGGGSGDSLIAITGSAYNNTNAESESSSLGAIPASGNGVVVNEYFTITEDVGTWKAKYLDTTGRDGYYSNPAEFWHWRALSTATIAAGTYYDPDSASEVQELLRTYADYYKPEVPDAVYLASADGTALDDGIDTETITLQIVDSSGDPVPYIRDIYVEATDGANAVLNSADINGGTNSAVITTDSSGLATFTLDNDETETVTVTAYWDAVTGGGNGGDSFGTLLSTSITVDFTGSIPPSISSTSSTTLLTSSADQPISNIIISDPEGGNLTIANGILIRVPSDLTDTYFDNSATIGLNTTGTLVVGAADFLPDPDDGDENIIYIPVTTGSAAGDTLTITGLQLDTGTVTGTDTIDMSLDGGTYAYSDDETITIQAAASNEYNWLGNVSTVWSNGSNWDQGSAPGAGNDVVIKNVTNSPVLDENTAALASLEIEPDASLDLAGFNLSTTTFTNDGTLMLEGGETVTITTFDSDSGTVEYTGDTGINAFAGLAAGDSYFNLTFSDSDSNDTWTLDNALDVNGDLSVSAGTLAQGANNINIAGDADFTGGAYTKGAGTMIFDSGSTQTLTHAGIDIGNFQLSTAGTSVTLTGSEDFDDVTIDASTTLTAGGDFTVGGDWSNNGDFVSGADTVTLDAVSGPVTIATGGTLDTQDFQNLTINDGGNTVAFTFTDALDVDGTLTVTDSDSVTFAAVTAPTVTLTDTTSTVSFSGDATITTLNTAAQGYDVSFTGGTTTITDDVNFLNTGTVTLGDSVDGSDSLAFNGGLATTGNVSNPSGTSIAGSVVTSNDQIDLGAVTMNGDSTILAGTAAVNISSITDGGNSYSLDLQDAAATGTVSFSGNVTINDLDTFGGAYAVVFNGAASTIDTDTIFNNTGGVTFGNGGDSITFTGGLDTTATSGT
ncbi:MAG: Ig-like domain-containing protein, partial [Spirochaetales bacterium]|nr:Ig-like domain-containing protein [Spirochaetales bacterium]